MRNVRNARSPLTGDEDGLLDSRVLASVAFFSDAVLGLRGLSAIAVHG